MLVAEVRAAGTVVRGGLIVLGALLEEERVGAGVERVFVATVVWAGDGLLLDFLLPTLALPLRVLPFLTQSLRYLPSASKG